MPYCRIKYLEKKEMGNNELEVQIRNIEDIEYLNINSGKYNSLDDDYLQLILDENNYHQKVIDYIKSNGYSPEDVGFDLGDYEDDILENYFDCHSLKEILDENKLFNEEEQIKEYIDNELENRYSNIFDFVSKEILFKELENHGYEIKEKED